MPIVVPINVTDSAEQWRQKTNKCIDSVNDIINNTAIADMLTVTSPANGDILIYDSTNGVFKNSASNVLIETWINNHNIKPTSRTREYFVEMSLNVL